MSRQEVKAFRRLLDYVIARYSDKVSEVFRRLSSLTPFEVLVITILSQNTNAPNTIKAFEELKRRVELSPEGLLKAPLEDVVDSIRVSGMYWGKARTLKNVASFVSYELGGDLGRLKSLGFENARKLLASVKGVGLKTADVTLMFAFGYDVLPVDTHIRRIALRLGLAKRGDSYEDVRLKLEALTPPGLRRAAHVALIMFGREVCKSRRPRCVLCPVNDVCPWVQRVEGQAGRPA